jgi:hypothetical protein
VTLVVNRESLTTDSRHTSPSFVANSGSQALIGVDDPMPQIGYGAQKLRDGKVYAIGVVNDFASPLANGASIDIGIAWSAGVTPTISFFGLCAGDALGFLYEGATLSGGTAATAVKLNRNSTLPASRPSPLAPL